jgi:hypothetical protein
MGLRARTCDDAGQRLAIEVLDDDLLHLLQSGLPIKLTTAHVEVIRTL